MFIGNTREWTESAPRPACKHNTLHLGLLKLTIYILKLAKVLPEPNSFCVSAHYLEAYTSINLPILSVRGSGIQHFGDGPASIVHVDFRQRGMNEKHQTCLSQFLCHGQAFRRTKFWGESFFEIDLAA